MASPAVSVTLAACRTCTFPEEKVMIKHAYSRRIVIGAAVIAVAAAASGAGVAAASATTSANTGTEHFYLMTTQPTAAKYEFIATGVFTASGTDVSGSKSDTVKLPKGSFKVNHGGQFHIIKQQVNAKTCFAVFEASAGISLSGGTGAYKGISGSGSATITDIAIGPKSKGKCNLNANPLANEETITAMAHVKV
jgi:hypothetical protein